MEGGGRTGADAADDGADEVGVEDFEGVVHLAHEFRSAEYVHGDPGDGAGAQAEENGAPSGHYARGGRDGDQAGDHALHGADDGGLLEENDVHDDPGEEAHGGADVRVEHGDAGVGAGGVRISPVEAVPPRPQDPCSDQHQGHVARFRVHSVRRYPGSYPPRAYESSRPGR